MSRLKKYISTIALSGILLVLSVCSLFAGVLDISLTSLLQGDGYQWEIFLISRLPRLLAILCTGVGMSVAGLILPFSMALNVHAVVLAMTGILNPVVGALVHNAGSVFVITNSAFLLKWKQKT